MSKNTKNETTAMTSPEDTSLSTNIAGIVLQDLQGVAIGRFCRLRAGIGLLRIKELNEHGNWEERMQELFPSRTGRTLQNYMKSSREWLEEHTLDLDEVWERLTKSDDQKLLADPNAPKPKKKDNPILAAVRDYMEEAPHKSIDEGADKSGRPLTKAERLEAVRSVVNKATNILQDEIQRNSLGILPDEDLDGLAAVLRTQSDSIRKMLAARGAKI